MKQFSMLLLSCFLTSYATYAQKALVISGGEITTSNYSLSYSVGQIAQKNNSNASGLFNQGVQQPFEIFNLFSLSSENFDDITLEMKVYPNPTVEYVNLLVKDESIINSQYRLFDLFGKTIQKSKITNLETRIYMNNLPKGTYLLQILSTNNSILKAFKIIKN